MKVEKAILGAVDYAMLGIMLTISASIGVYFRFSGGKQKTTEEYLLAGKNMSIFPVAFSLMASFLSAVQIIGIPAEVFHFGLFVAYFSIPYAIGMILSSYLTLPVFFEIQASTAYEYLDRRFGKFARIFTSLCFAVQMILFTSVVLYAPALALSAVTNLSTWVSVTSLGIVCTFYCTLGGMKAVLWTDVFQGILMYVGISSVIIKGFMDVGFTNVFRITVEGGRIVVPGLDVNLTTRYTMWNILSQGVILSMGSFSSNQVQVQRMLTVKNINRSRRALWLHLFYGVSFQLMTCLAGIVIYAYFASCDPMTPPNNPIARGDQLLPYFMLVSLGDYPGLSGLCMCGIFSASLSTVSSAINSLTAVTMQDLVRPFFEKKGYSQKKQAIVAQAISSFFGFLCLILTFLVASFGNVFQASLSVFGMVGGPVLSIFLLGMLTTRSNQMGAIIGLLTGIGISAWIGFGSASNGPRHIELPTSKEGCPVYNYSLVESSNSSNTTTLPNLLYVEQYSILKNESEFITAEHIDDDIFPLYKTSYMWLAPIGFVTAYVIGYIASIIINLITGDTLYVPQELISPVMQRFNVHKSAKKRIKINYQQTKSYDEYELKEDNEEAKSQEIERLVELLS